MDHYKLNLRGIVGEEITPDVVSAGLDQADGGDVYVRLSTNGGAIDQGLDIYATLKDYTGHVTIDVTSMAASMGSVILQAADERLIRPTGTVMVHDPLTFMFGNAREFREVAQVLDLLGEQLAGTYAARSGRPVDEWRAIMSEERYFSADESVEFGLVDRVIESANDLAPPVEQAAAVSSFQGAAAVRGQAAIIAANRFRRRI